ncbi:aspartyl aminopeptidase [Pelomyxa schiedti]|nr:aspartyl aminopeptidase [Pelomyxa schiedti]
MATASVGHRFVDFLNGASGSPFAACVAVQKELLAAGFTKLNEESPWTLTPGGRYFVTRNGSSVVAFAVGARYAPVQSGCSIVGAHIDSPFLKLKPSSAVESCGTLSIACEVYGGGIWQTWFDRDLGIAGRVFVKEGDGYAAKVVRITRPLFRIPTVATHLDMRYADGWAPNKENDLRAIAAVASTPSDIGAISSFNTKSGRPKHHPVLLAMLAREIGCSPEAICNFELALCDSQPATIGGVLGDYIFSQGLDNLNGSFCALQGFLQSTASLATEKNIRMIFLFDHEEVGSMSPQGADSPIVLRMIERIVTCLPRPSTPISHEELVDIMLRKSLILSIDNAHAVHPNNPGKHESQHAPQMNKGPVLKYNVCTRYATEGVGALLMLKLAAEHNIPIQEFVVRQDMPCGTTIGPISSSKTSIRTVDLGNPQLSMHSIREVCGVADIGHMSNLILQFFNNHSSFNVNLDG